MVYFNHHHKSTLNIQQSKFNLFANDNLIQFSNNNTKQVVPTGGDDFNIETSIKYYIFRNVLLSIQYL